jgi:hypothetical protein
MNTHCVDDLRLRLLDSAVRHTSVLQSIISHFIYPTCCSSMKIRAGETYILLGCRKRIPIDRHVAADVHLVLEERNVLGNRINVIVSEAAQEDGVAGGQQLDDVPALAGQFGGAARRTAAIRVHEEAGFD